MSRNTQSGRFGRFGTAEGFGIRRRKIDRDEEHQQVVVQLGQRYHGLGTKGLARSLQELQVDPFTAGIFGRQQQDFDVRQRLAEGGMLPRDVELFEIRYQSQSMPNRHGHEKGQII